jgi:hypothetical protein
MAFVRGLRLPVERVDNASTARPDEVWPDLFPTAMKLIEIK